MEESKRHTRIYAGFPGVGKSYLFKNNNGMIVSDSDSTLFSWLDKDAGVRHPEFPNNYIKHIQSLIGKVDIILVSTHSVVLKALRASGINFTVVYPDRSLKEDYKVRYQERGSDEAFVNLIYKMWDSFIDDIESTEAPKIKLTNSNQNLTDVLE